MTTKIWHAQYSPNVPTEINPDAYRNIVEIVDKSCRRFLGRPAFTNMGATLTFGDLDRLTRNFATYLKEVLGLKKGDRIAIQMPNLLQYPVVLFGALRAGLVIVNTNPLYTPREMEHQFKDSGAVAIVILANYAKNLQEVLPQTNIKHVIVTEIGDLLPFPKSQLINFAVKYVKKMVPAYDLPGAVMFKEALRLGMGKVFTPVDIEPSDLAFLQYTGGTTGVAKGAMLSHRNVIANMEQISVWIGTNLIEGQEIIITALPMYHIFSLTINCLVFMKWGGHNILITNPRDMNAFVKDLAKYPFTIITAVNTLFNGLMNNEKFQKLNFKSLKISVGGAMAVQKVVAEKWKAMTGNDLVEGYGLTETSPVITVNRLEPGFVRIGTIGLPVPSTDVSIRDDNDQPVPFGQSGEICAKGPQVMQGYWQRPEETALAIVDGWFHTGDIGIMDEQGYSRIVDRKKDMILVSGFNVYPNEIEDVVASHPGVLEVAAVGVPDEHSGEIVKIFVVKKDPALTAEDLKKHCKQNLTAYKVPRQIEFRAELPKTNVGKILRRQLRDEKRG